MKRIFLLTVLLALITAFKTEASTPADFQFGIFYSSLSPYGSWIEINSGMVVWQPAPVRGWSPYRTGRWIWTDAGWYWDSYEPYGYITYHYGRWYLDDYYGWIWVPDYEWAPAWVEWRYDNDYIGWAPLAPYATFSINVGIVFSNNYYTPYSCWQYVDYGHFCDPYAYNYYVPEKVKYRVHSHTKYRTGYTYRNGGVYNGGIDVGYVRERSGRNIEERGLYRTNDVNELRNKGGRNDDRLRTFSVSRDQLKKDNSGLRDLQPERGTKKSSLLTSKVEIGERLTNNQKGKDQLRKSGKDNQTLTGTRNPKENTGMTNRTATKNDNGRKDNIVRNNNEQKRIITDYRQPDKVKTQNKNNESFSMPKEMKQQEVATRNNSFQENKNNQNPNMDVRKQNTDQRNRVEVQRNQENRKNETVTRNEKKEEVKRTTRDSGNDEVEKSGRQNGRTKQR